MRFTKMQGCGNDYVYVNGIAERIPAEEKPEIVKRLSDRHFGIGGDGVIFINAAPNDDCDFEMEMWNADGTRAQMCGNGIRCVAKYVFDKHLTDKTSLRIISGGSIKYLELTTAKDEKTGEETVREVRVDMGSPILEPEKIPVDLTKTRIPGAETGIALNTPILVGGRRFAMTCVSMGNPHAVVFVDSTADFPLEQIGPLFEHHSAFPERVNTEFVQILDRKNVNMRVWERGTGETLACGTGACAVCVACVLGGHTEEEITVHLLGGDLRIRYDRAEEKVYMTGPATTVFEGEVEL